MVEETPKEGCDDAGELNALFDGAPKASGLFEDDRLSPKDVGACDDAKTPKAGFDESSVFFCEPKAICGACAGDEVEVMPKVGAFC